MLAQARTSVLRWLMLLPLAVLAAYVVERAVAPATPELPGPMASASSPVAFAGIARTYDQAVERADLAVATADERVRLRPDEWLGLEALAKAYHGRGRLLGNYADFAAAQSALDRAFELAPRGAGPHLAQAVLDFGVHRLARAEKGLAAIEGYAVPPGDGDRAELELIRADIAFYRGDYDGALAGYRRGAAIDPEAHVDFRMALYHSKTGRPDLARAAFDRAERSSPATPQTRANYELLRGILDLDRGRLGSALAQFRRADANFPGHWLIEEHIAEVLALQGDLAAARPIYEGIVARTGHPEFMDALAAIARRGGDRAAAARWTLRAEQEWDRRLRLFPEAAYGHALDHYMGAGEPARALDLAQRNDRARPHGEAKIALAHALLISGRKEQARQTVEAVLATRWRTTELHALAAEIYDLLGLPEAAAAQRRAEAKLAAL